MAGSIGDCAGQGQRVIAIAGNAVSTGGGAEQFDRYMRQASFAGALQPIAVFITPDAVTNLDRRGITEGHDVTQADSFGKGPFLADVTGEIVIDAHRFAPVTIGHRVPVQATIKEGIAFNIGGIDWVKNRRDDGITPRNR